MAPRNRAPAVARLLLPLLALAALLAACSGSDDPGAPTPDPDLPVILVHNSAGEAIPLSIEIADTSAARTQGLMHRDTLPEGQGMLFVYEQPTSTGFWMRNTTIPLSIAFITNDGTIFDIQDMEPLSEELHIPPAPFQFALEVNQGWFDRHGVMVGDHVEAVP